MQIFSNLFLLFRTLYVSNLTIVGSTSLRKVIWEEGRVAAL